MLRLFDENSKYNAVAEALDTAISAAVGPVLKQYADAGYCPRDIQYVASTAILDKTLLMLLTPVKL